NSASSTYLDMMINAYLSTFKAYSSAGELSFEEVASATNSDLKNGIDVEKSSATTSSIHESINRFFNFLSYPIMCILILGLSIVSISLNQSDVRRRNLASPMNQLKFNLSIFGATMLLAIATWALLCLLSLANFGSSVLETLHIYHIINMFVFTLVAVSLSFLIGQVATLGSINPIANVISLGFCFLGGAFVPQELLTGAAGKIALIDPAHWYIKANIFVTTLSEFSFDNLMPYFKYLGIELLFAVVFLAVGLVVSKYKNAEKLA
ncbi:MAG: ABC transporter permease, partial [Oscillospiraceae bacterium]